MKLELKTGFGSSNKVGHGGRGGVVGYEGVEDAPFEGQLSVAATTLLLGNYSPIGEKKE